MIEELSPTTLKGEGGERYERVRVTIEVDYFVPAATPEIRDALVQEWFFDGRYPLYGSHAYRDHQKLGYSERVVRVERLSDGQDVAPLRRRPLSSGVVIDMDGTLSSIT